MLFAASLAGCGDNIIPALRAGESAHFRLWVDNHLPPLDSIAADVALAALESNWTDMRTIFAMPDAKIDYYWLTEAHLRIACQWSQAGGCNFGNRVISSVLAPQYHELNHAYAALLRSESPLPFLAEGLATALGCHEGGWPVSDVPWRSIATDGYQEAGVDLYPHAARFAHHLITAYGAEAYLRYYRQAPAPISATTLARNFQSFWGQSLDDVWAAMLATPKHRLSARQTWPICPCSIAPTILDGNMHPELRQNGYWLVPDLEGDTFVATAPEGEGNTLIDCAAETTAAVGFGTVLARRPGPHRVMARTLQATAGKFLAESCQEAQPFNMPLSRVDGELRLHASSVAPGGEGFLQLQTSAPRQIWSRSAARLAVCSTCAFDLPGCAPLPRGTRATVTGQVYLRFLWPSQPPDPGGPDITVQYAP